MMQLKLLYCKLFEVIQTIWLWLLLIVYLSMQEAYHETVPLCSDSAQETVAYLTGELKQYEQYSCDSDNQPLQYLQWVGTVRFILDYFTTLTRHKHFSTVAQLDDAFHHAYNQLLLIVKEICHLKSTDDCELQPGPHVLLLKLMYRSFGEVALKDIQQDPSMTWILPVSLISPELKNVCIKLILKVTITINLG